jgi:hypothetical protein
VFSTSSQESEWFGSRICRPIAIGDVINSIWSRLLCSPRLCCLHLNLSRLALRWHPCSEPTSRSLCVLPDNPGLLSVNVHSALLIRRPMIAQCSTAAFLFGAGDIIAQQAVERKGKEHDVSPQALTYRRCATFCTTNFSTLLVLTNS